MSNRPPKILVVSPAWIGDAVMMHSLIKLLRQNQPDAIIHVLTPKICVDVVKCMPEVNDVIVAAFGHGDRKLNERWVMGKMLLEQNYTQAIITPNSLKSSLIPFFAKIPVRTGWRGEWRYGLLNDMRVLDQKRYPLMVERLLALGLPKDAPLPEEKIWPTLQANTHKINATNQALGLDPDAAPVLVFCPGAAYGPAKRWPAKHFATVANTKIAQGWQVWILGSKSDADIAAEINQLTGDKCHDFTSKTTLAQAIDLIAQAKNVVTNDTGLMHIAAALNRDVIALYGSSSPKFTPPLSERIKILWLAIECSPCFKRECPLGHFQCMEDLLPQQVLDSL